MSVPAYTLDDLNLIVKEGIKFATLDSVSVQDAYINYSSTSAPTPDVGDNMIMLHGTIKIPTEIAYKYKFTDSNLQGLFYSLVHPILNGQNPNFSLNESYLHFYNNEQQMPMSGGPSVFSFKDEKFLNTGFTLSMKVKSIATIASNIASVGFYKVLEEELSKD